LNLLTLLTLLAPLASPAAVFPEDASAAPLPAGKVLPAGEPFEDWTDLFRTWVTLPNSTSRARLESLGVVVLQESGARALVLADAEQLEALARLRFKPEASDDLGMLMQDHAEALPWLAASLQPLLAQGKAVRALSLDDNMRLSAEDAPSVVQAQADLHAAMAGLTPEQRAGIMGLTSLDSDGDGLTDTAEAWWCTDPGNPNSDGDAQGYTDGQEVAALLDFTLPRATRWGYGAPFGPPNAWPDFNGMDGNPTTPACNDGDYDTIPDYAEIFMVGSRVPEESTDRDKFDDGQELFGVTYCPGAPTSCGYGSYPRIEYWNYIKATMPTWVLPPGDNLFVAAFPVPEVSVIPGSWTVERVTTITTQQGQMTQQEHSYETGVMRGESTSIANTVTWNNWEEVSEAVETPFDTMMLLNSMQHRCPAGDLKCFALGGLKMLGGAAGLGVAGLICAGTFWGCAVGGVAAIPLSNLAESGFNDWFGPDEAQNQQQTQYNITNINQASSTASANASVILSQNFDFQGVVNSLDGVQYAINRQGELMARGLQDISYQISRPRLTETRTNGHSWGGAQTTTHEVYEEHTISEGEAFTTGENWSTAWAVDSSHAANLTFNYTIKNTGTEYARELTGLVFNIYLGDDTTPIISYPAWQQFPNGKLENVFPGAVNTFASTAIPLTLEQMKRIDLGDRLVVVLEDYSYGADELFYQDAINGGVTVYIEDGVDDGDELVDSYVIPTWGVESVQDVLTRFFPAGYDLDGKLNALWTPEFNGINPPTWNEHYLSDIAWWNVYLTQADGGNTPLKDLAAQAGSALLFRFNRDSDRDGYQDRVEVQYGTDKNDPASHPQPEVLAGYVASRSGNVVTVKLVLENSGTFDAYGIDAVMYSPDATTTIGNNTVGGNGRVRPGAHVAVGSLIQPPALNGWGASTAKPYAGGQFTGSADRVFTFSAATPGVVGQSSTSVAWNDGAGNSGTLALGSSYHAPLPLDVAQGLQVGFNTGTIMAGATFTVSALTPRDTFTYTINSEPYTPPVIVVSYSDPQGSHRFVTPVELPTMDASLAPYTGQMLKGLALEVATTDAVNTSGTNITNLIVNNPHPATIENGHLYVNFVSDGQLVAELPFTLTIPAGPTVFPVNWSTSVFSETYDSEADNILIAFWTDSEGNIIDSAARPLNTFAVDPSATLETGAPNVSWDFGTARQGTVLKRSFDLANTGYLDLLTYVNAPTGVTLSQQGSRRVGPADVTTYEITLDTASMPVGPYDRNITIRSSDPENPLQTVRVLGTVTAAPCDGFLGEYFSNQTLSGVPALTRCDDLLDFNWGDGSPDPAIPVNQFSARWTKRITAHSASNYRFDVRSDDGVRVYVDNQLVVDSWVDQDFLFASGSKLLTAGEHDLRVEWYENAGGAAIRLVYGPEETRMYPLDWPVALASGTQGQWIQYTHTLGPDTQTLHPVKVYSQNYATLWGVGKYATQFGQGTASYEMFGDGINGDLVVSSGQTMYGDDVRAPLAATAYTGQLVISFNPNPTGTISRQVSPYAKHEGWIDYGLRVAIGDDLLVRRVFPNDGICYGGGQCYGPNGSGESAPSGWLAPGLPKFSLVGRIGNGPPFFIGENNHVTLARNGTLFIGLNDCLGCYGDNEFQFGGHALMINIYVSYSFAPQFSSNQEVLIIQMTGTDAGKYEFATVGSTGSGTLILNRPLQNSYTTGGNSRAQIIGVPHYRNVTVQAGGQLASRQWDGTTGGVLAMRVQDSLTIESDARICVSRNGFSGGSAWYWHDSTPGYQGWSYTGVAPTTSQFPNGGGGGGGQNAGGGGGGYGTAGANGMYGGTGGLGGGVYGSADLGLLFLGSGGGGTTHAHDNAADGSRGGGITMIVARTLNISGGIDANGQGGGQPSYTYTHAPDIVWNEGRGGGGGSGGSIKIVASVANLGNNKITATGGPGGRESGNRFYGGNGGDGRIRIEYCESLSGSTNPPASVQKLNCYIAEQVESAPYTTTRLNLPETFTDGRTYQVQYGRRQVFSSAGEQTSALRLPAGAFAEVRLDALLSDAGTGSRTFRLDIGNDGSWDWEWTGNVTNAISLNSGNLAAAFSAYWAAHGAPTASTLDVPFKVYLSQAGQVLLTNLQVTPTGSKVRYAQLPAQTYTGVTLNFSVGESGSGPLTVAADVGDNGSVDWTYTAASATYPLALTTGNLATAFNAYLAGHTGEVAVPVRFYVAPFLGLTLRNFSAAMSSRPDLTLTAGDITFGATAPTEESPVPITVTLYNNGALAATGHTVAFYAATPEWGEWYIGSAFVPGIAAGGTAQASITWDTSGFTGDTAVRVVLDPYDRLAETNEDNNQASKSLTILTRADLKTSFAEFSNPEPVVGETVTVTLQVQNLGQTAAGPFGLALYAGNPDDGGVLLQAANLAVSAGGQVAIPLTWTPTAAGSQRLFVVVDQGQAINDADRSNNLAWQEVYVGFAGPLLLDSGGTTDPPYSAVPGYGVVDEGPVDVVGTCGPAVHESYRLDTTSTGGRVIYNFDHLLPGHFYHLDVTLYKCGLAGRQENIRVNGQQVAGPVDLGDGEIHRLSLLLDPALYAGRTIRVEIEALNGAGALVNAINLYDVDYRYADAGGSRDPAYPGGNWANLGRPYGWLNGVENIAWGTLPSHSVRLNPLGNVLEYRFDGLDPDKRYNIHLTFWQPSGAGRIQRVQLDGLDTGLTVNTGDYQVHGESLAVPPPSYAADGSLVVSVKRVNETTDVILNELALEEETLPRSNWCRVSETPYFTDVYGDVAILGQGAPVGTVITALNPRGDVVGCFVVGTSGRYGFMRVYGEDTSAWPTIPGMRARELVEFRVSGASAVATPLLYWQADYGSHHVDLNAGAIHEQSILLNAGWNLMSFRLEPPVPTVRQVLNSMDGRYDRVLGETGIYVPSLPDVYHTLKELHPGHGYYVRVPGSTAVTALFEGVTVPATTPLPLHAGWNWIGYLPSVTLPITQALQSIAGQYQRVLSVDKAFDPALPAYSTLHFLEPGKGYLIYTNQAITLTYPSGGALQGVEPRISAAFACADLRPTPQFTLLYGNLSLAGHPAPVGSRVEVLTPRGELAGCFVVEKPGLVGLMPVYGADARATPPLAGFQEGEALAFRINGMPVEAAALTWQDDWTAHAITLQGDGVQIYLPLVVRER